MYVSIYAPRPPLGPLGTLSLKTGCVSGIFILLPGGEPSADYSSEKKKRASMRGKGVRENPQRMIRLLARALLQRIARNRRFWWWVRCIRLCLTGIIFLACIDLLRDLLFLTPQPPNNHHKVEAQDFNQTINSVYIVSAQYNSEGILRSSWIPSLLKLVEELQSAQIRVYVAIYESGSVDGTKSVLSELETSLAKLDVEHDVRLDDESHASAIEKSLATPAGWVQTRYGKELRRVSFLADVRNRALEPLENLTKAGVKFDRILYLNDVVFSVRFFAYVLRRSGRDVTNAQTSSLISLSLLQAQDALTLLNTRNGNYAAACGLDFMNPPWGYVSGPASLHPPGTYDDFATRDSNGHVLISHLYPYFTFGKSKAALLAGQPIPVQSCWNGLGTSPHPKKANLILPATPPKTKH